MKCSVSLGFLLLGCLTDAFSNGPGSRLQNGGHSAHYEAILPLSEELIATEIGENSTALAPYSRNTTVDDIGTSPVDARSVFKRQDGRPPGALKCGPGSPCIDESCCGSNGVCGFKDANCGKGCTSHCEAKANCGIDSAGGKSCGLKLCCSFYGWCGDVHCIDPEPTIGKTPCQKDYGSCAVKPKPECGTDGGSGSANWRRIAYYAGWNTKDRACDKVFPKDINIKGLTHLMYSFVGFDPTTFAIVADPHDVPQFKPFTARASSSLRTWIAVGGWSFNEPGDTANAFSNMVSTSGNRAAFIKSLMKFMDDYGFTGADIDWEYPSNPERGGNDADKKNLVELAKDMKAAFGTKYGLSVVIAPDYWYLQGFAPADMQQYVDHLGFMAYDLHGPWDSENALGSLIRPHTDIRDIDEGLTPLWFDGVDPSKVVMGIAYYGRTFTAASADCPVMGCAFSGPGKKNGCTQSEGVLSNMDIRKIIKDQGTEGELLEGAMVKELIYDNDQWVGYDDEETIALKEAFARKRCLGGTMIWSIDYDSPTSDPGDGNDGDDNGGNGGEEQEGEYPDDLDILNKIGTRLSGYYGCVRSQANAIAGAYIDAHLLLNEGRVQDLPWDSLIAADFFGPSKYISDEEKGQIQAVYKNLLTVTPGSVLNPVKWTIYVSCNDFANPPRCETSRKDPCKSPDDDVSDDRLIAYSANVPGTFNGPRINFCPVFFRTPTLGDAMLDTPILPYPARAELQNYVNTATTMLHEMTHLFLGSDSIDDRPNPHPRDLQVAYNVKKDDGSFEKKLGSIYGTQLTKILAMYNPDDDWLGMDTGFYTQRNADNLALYCLAVYVNEHSIGYPYLPLVPRGPHQAPVDAHGRALYPPTVSWSFDASDDGAAVFNLPDYCDSQGVVLEGEIVGSTELVNLKGLSPWEDYPQEYRDMYEKGMEELATWWNDDGREDFGYPDCRPGDSLTAHETDIRNTVDRLCSNKEYWDKLVVPAISFGYGEGKVLGANEYLDIHDGRDKLWVAIGHIGGSCVGSFKFATGSSDEDKIANCKKNFEPIVTGCRHDNLETYGGSLDIICRRMQIMIVSADQEHPTSPPSGGDFKCEDFEFDPEVLDPNVYSNTCKCWLTSDTAATDIFKRPDNFGKCSDVNEVLNPLSG